MNVSYWNSNQKRKIIFIAIKELFKSSSIREYQINIQIYKQEQKKKKAKDSSFIQEPRKWGGGRVGCTPPNNRQFFIATSKEK
jgi:hypothetical protein